MYDYKFGSFSLEFKNTDALGILHVYEKSAGAGTVATLASPKIKHLAEQRLFHDCE